MKALRKGDAGGRFTIVVPLKGLKGMTLSRPACEPKPHSYSLMPDALSVKGVKENATAMTLVQYGGTKILHNADGAHQSGFNKSHGQILLDIDATRFRQTGTGHDSYSDHYKNCKM